MCYNELKASEWVEQGQCSPYGASVYFLDIPTALSWQMHINTHLNGEDWCSHMALETDGLDNQLG